MGHTDADIILSFCVVFSRIKNPTKHLIISQGGDLKKFDDSSAHVTNSESSALLVPNSKAYIQFSFMYFRDGSVQCLV